MLKAHFVFRIFRKAYLFLSGIVFAFLLTVILLNVVGILLVKIQARSDMRGVLSRDTVHAQSVGLTLGELDKLKAETWSCGYIYEPWTGFREKPRRGQYVNVLPDGYRQTPGIPQNPKQLVVLLGGSTMFGYNVTDEQTIAAFLQKMVAADPDIPPTEIRNYGRAHYYSEQEFILLLQILKNGKDIPRVVVFLDGYNERPPVYTQELAEIFQTIQENEEEKLLMKLLLKRSPMMPVLHKVLPMFFRSEPVWSPKDYEATEEQIAERYQLYLTVQENTRAICRQYHIMPFFFLQPIAGFHNQFTSHLREVDIVANKYKGMLMERMATLASEGKIVDLSGTLSGYAGPAFVDFCHYTPEVNRMIAGEIFRRIRPDLVK